MADEGVTAATLSMELSLRQMAFAAAAPMPVGLFAYGRQPLMLLRDCPRTMTAGCANGSNCSLTDRKGVVFPLACTSGGIELLNAVPLFLADRLDELPLVDFLYLHFTDEAPDDVTPVSYTHLDVYKRQVYRYSEITVFLIKKLVYYT